MFEFVELMENIYLKISQLWEKNNFIHEFFEVCYMRFGQVILISVSFISVTFGFQN